MNKHTGLTAGITVILAVLFTASSPAAAQETVSLETPTIHAEQFRQLVIRAERRPMFSPELLQAYVTDPARLHRELVAEGAIIDSAAATGVVGPAPVISGNTALACMFSGCAQNYISFWLTGQNLQHIAWGMMTPKGVSYGQGAILSHLSGYQGPIKLGVIFQFPGLGKPFTFTGGTDDNSKIVPPAYAVR